MAAIAFSIALLCRRGTTIDETEATGLLDEQFDDRLGAAEIELAPPLLVRLNDRECAELVAHFGIVALALFLILATGRCALCRAVLVLGVRRTPSSRPAP